MDRLDDERSTDSEMTRDLINVGLEANLSIGWEKWSVDIRQAKLRSLKKHLLKISLLQFKVLETAQIRVGARRKFGPAESKKFWYLANSDYDGNKRCLHEIWFGFKTDQIVNKSF